MDSSELQLVVTAKVKVVRTLRRFLMKKVVTSSSKTRVTACGDCKGKSCKNIKEILMKEMVTSRQV